MQRTNGLLRQWVGGNGTAFLFLPLIPMCCLKLPPHSKVFGDGTKAAGPPERPLITTKTAYRLMMKQVGGAQDNEQGQVSSTSILCKVQSTEHILGHTSHSDIS